MTDPVPGGEASPSTSPSTRDDGSIRVVVADDHALYRQSLKVVITLDGDITVVGEAGNGFEAVDEVAAHEPDVLVIDGQMPCLSGADAVRAIARVRPETKILMLTMSDESENLLDAVRAGVHAYLIKDTPGDKVADAIRRVHRGEIVMSRRALAALLNQLLRCRPQDLTNPASEAMVRRLHHVVQHIDDERSIAADSPVGQEIRDLLAEFRHGDRRRPSGRSA